jgi:hypothetical protein
MSNQEVVAKEIRVERVYPEDLQSHFVSNLVVQHRPEFFILSFFEVWPPAILGETEEEKKQVLDNLDHVEAKCVSRIVLTPGKMQEFVEVMSENLEKWEQMLQLQSEWEQD